MIPDINYGFVQQNEGFGEQSLLIGIHLSHFKRFGLFAITRFSKNCLRIGTKSVKISFLTNVSVIRTQRGVTSGQTSDCCDVICESFPLLKTFVNKVWIKFRIKYCVSITSRFSSFQMEIPGFYYDKQRKKYFRIQPGSSGQNYLTNEAVRQKSSLEAVEDYKRSDPSILLPRTLHRHEIDFHTKYNFQEEVIRSRLKAMKPTTTYDIEVIDYCGEIMQNVNTNALIGSPESSDLFAVVSGDSGSVIYHFPIDDILQEEFNINDKKHFVNAYSKPNRVVDISFTNGSKCGLLSTIVHHFPSATAINTSFTLTAISDQFDTHLMRQVYEFAEPIFSGTHYEDMNVLGGERQIYVFKPSYSGNIKIIKLEESITALKTSCDGKLFIAGTNKGRLISYDVKSLDSLTKRSELKLFDRSVTSVHCLQDSNRVIASCHNHYLCLTDLRMFEKPVLQYQNHSNNCSKIPLCVDETVDVLCSAGDDSLVRFWSLSSGKLLHILCPNNANKNNLPSVQPISRISYSNSWNFLNGKSKPYLFGMNRNQLTAMTVEDIDEN